MTIQSAAIYNGAIAGIIGGLNDGRQPSSSTSLASVVAAAAAAVDAAIGAVVGGGSPAQAALVQSLCYAEFSGRAFTSTNQSNYTAIATAIATAYSQQAANISGTKGVSKVITVTLPAATPGPATANTTIGNAAFVGASAIDVQIIGVPADGTNTISSLMAYVASPPSVGGVVTLVVSSIVGYTGENENIQFTVTG